MPIDSTCSGCGKTLRVNDEFVGRKARCPVCGTVYTVSPPDVGEAEVLQAIVDPASTETTYAPSSSFQEVQINPVKPMADSWSSMPTSQPVSVPSVPLNETQSSLASTSQTGKSGAPSKQYFVRTPNSMVYGPSTAEVVYDWIREGRLDDTCHIREEASEQWLGIPAWRFQTRTQQNPMSSPVASASSNPFGSIPVASVQSVSYASKGNGVSVLVLGLLSWLLCFTFLGGIVCAILAVVFGMTELKKIRQGQSPSKEKAIVLIGLWLGIANLALWCLGVFGVILTAILNP